MPHNSFSVISAIGLVILALIYWFGDLENSFLMLGIAGSVIIGFDLLFSNIITYSKRDKSFEDRRFARNIFEKTLEHQANRIAKETMLTKEILTTIKAEGIVE